MGSVLVNIILPSMEIIWLAAIFFFVGIVLCVTCSTELIFCNATDKKIIFRKGYYVGIGILFLIFVLCLVSLPEMDKEHANAAQNICEAYGIQEEYQEEIADALSFHTKETVTWKTADETASGA